MRKPKNLRIDVEPVTARTGAFGGNQHDHVVLKEALASKRAIDIHDASKREELLRSSVVNSGKAKTSGEKTAYVGCVLAVSRLEILTLYTERMLSWKQTTTLPRHCTEQWA